MPYTNLVTYRRAELYDDGSGPAVAVEYAPNKLIDGLPTITIHGIGGEVSVEVERLGRLIGWLYEVQQVASIKETK